VRALIDGFFLQWLEENDWTAVHARYKTMCVRAILRYLGAAEATAAAADDAA
jgi:hypothetical protein